MCRSCDLNNMASWTEAEAGALIEVWGDALENSRD